LLLEARQPRNPLEKIFSTVLVVLLLIPVQYSHYCSAWLKGEVSSSLIVDSASSWSRRNDFGGSHVWSFSSSHGSDAKRRLTVCPAHLHYVPPVRFFDGRDPIPPKGNNDVSFNLCRVEIAVDFLSLNKKDRGVKDQEKGYAVVSLPARCCCSSTTRRRKRMLLAICYLQHAANDSLPSVFGHDDM